MTQLIRRDLHAGMYFAARREVIEDYIRDMCIDGFLEPIDMSSALVGVMMNYQAQDLARLAPWSRA
jgi:hypothetical protein